MGTRVRAERPHMPGYGVSGSSEGLLPWSWAVERLARSQNFWLSTLRENGRPHAMPVWAVWVNDGVHFSTGQTTVKTRNLDRSGECVITTEHADEPVIIEGYAQRVAANLVDVVAAYEKKYGMPYPPDSALFRLAPRVAFGFIEEPSRFSASATRWIFESD